MKGVTKALTSMNKQISLPGLQKIMTEFMKENERADLTQEAIGDTLDDAMADETSEAEVGIASVSELTIPILKSIILFVMTSIFVIRKAPLLVKY